ncbi:unnamed protein product, partial [Musa acuminata subsp. burmannicoides]
VLYGHILDKAQYTCQHYDTKNISVGTNRDRQNQRHDCTPLNLVHSGISHRLSIAEDHCLIMASSWQRHRAQPTVFRRQTLPSVPMRCRSTMQAKLTA